MASQKMPGESATRAERAQRAQPAERESDFEAVFVEHYPRVYGALFRLVGDRAEAEDLTLETFWRLWQRPPETLRRPAAHGDDNLGGWLYRVAMRLGYNALRGAKRRVRYEEQAGRDALERDAPPDPAHEVAQRQERERVRQMLRQMPEREAQLLILRHSGLSYKEVAAALGVAPASVGTLLARAEAEFEKLWSSAK
ncbi:MAG: sigma-70 family RNA polymerase sigma factor [Anaerolineales bacterium]